MARVAIIAAVLFGCVVTAQAAGFDIIGAIARWTSEQFHYVTGNEVGPELPNESRYHSLQEALDEYGITVPLSPQEFPEGTELVEVIVKTVEDLPIFSAEYNVDGERIYISIRQIGEDIYSEIEINDSDNVEVYTVAGIEHHIMKDVKQQKAVWHNGLWECRISGILSTDELIAMIDSIYS